MPPVDGAAAPTLTVIAGALTLITVVGTVEADATESTSAQYDDDVTMIVFVVAAVVSVSTGLEPNAATSQHRR